MEFPGVHHEAKNVAVGWSDIATPLKITDESDETNKNARTWKEAIGPKCLFAICVLPKWRSWFVSCVFYARCSWMMLGGIEDWINCWANFLVDLQWASLFVELEFYFCWLNRCAAHILHMFVTLVCRFVKYAWTWLQWSHWANDKFQGTSGANMGKWHVEENCVSCCLQLT